MVNVAIAGGSSPTLGNAIVKAILATNGRHTPIILSRRKHNNNHQETSTSTTTVDGVAVEVRHVDYQDPATLTPALADIHTLLSVLLIINPSEFVAAHLNLLHASLEVGVKRFAPSEWAFGSPAHAKALFVDAPKIEVWDAVEKAAGGNRIEATRFVCGGFMNYLGIGCPGSQERQDEALAGFRERPFLFGLRDGWAEVPLKPDGTYPRITMTELGDIGRFVAAALDLEAWESSEMAMAGDVLSFGEVLHMAERVTGREFRVKEVRKEDLEGEIEQLGPQDFIRRMECTYAMLYCDDLDGETALDPLLNRLCPQVKPVTVAEYLEKYWGGGGGNS